MSVNAIACAVPRERGPGEPRPWPSYLRVPGLAPSANDTLAAAPTLQWTTPVGRGAAGPPAVGDSVIVVATTEGAVVVVSRATGQRIWRDRLDSPAVSGPLVHENRVFTATGDGHVYAHDLPAGRTLWDRAVKSVVGPLTIAGGRILAATAAGQVVALETARGAIVWRRDLGRVLRSGPVVVDDRLIVATDDSLVALNPDDGVRIGAAAARGLGLNPPARAGHLLIYGLPDGAVAAYDATTLAQAWRVETREGVSASPVVARDTVIAVTTGGTVWMIPLSLPGSATSTGLDIAVRVPAAPIADGILIVSVSGEILRVAPPSAEPHWKTRVDGPLYQPPIVDRGLLVLVDGRGRIQAWR